MQNPTIPLELLTTSEQVSDVAKLLRQQERIAVDSESNSRHRYPESVCLVQIATSQSVYLIDALAVKDMVPIGEVLGDASVMKVMQAADNDVREFDREWGFRVRNIFDTQLAARFVGIKQVGLPSLSEALLGLHMQKDSRIQRSDWTRRPLKEASMAYAAADVWHLLDMHRVLANKLQILQRLDWVSEECELMERSKYVPKNPDVAYLSLKGVGKLNGRSKAILKRLFAVRESEAKRRGIPPYYVLSHETLLTLASNPGVDFANFPSIRNQIRSQFSSKLREAIRKGSADPQITEPVRSAGTRPSVADIERLTTLTNWRRALARKLSIDEALIWPSKSMDRLARAPDTLESEFNSGEIRQWQLGRFANSLRDLLG